ncbi:MAG: sugar-binding transcriptional regulator [Candidatus Humimicrobiaceae bacterium]
MNDLVKLKLISKVAQLYYLENYMQKDIAKKMSISRVAVSRILSKAKKLKLVEIKINNLKDSFQDLELVLEKKFKLKECVVVSSFENEKNTFIELAKYLSETLNRVVNPQDYIGVSWGYSLGIISENIEIRQKSNIKVVPIIGSLGVIEEGINSNVIAKNFALGFGGVSYLINSPAVLESIEAKSVMENEENNKRIFELSKNLDVVIIGASDLGPQSSLHKFSNYKSEDFKYLTKLGVEGVVNLSSIDKNGNVLPNIVDKRTIALSFDKLRKVKNVILIAVGKRKKKVIEAALKSGIVSILMTDEITARSINI